jgi:hypothetical protein
MRNKPKVYRLSFDFKSAQGLLDFWEDFVAVSITPTLKEEGKDFRTCHPMRKDSMHDKNKSVMEFLVREDNVDNGRRLEIRHVPGVDRETVL